MSDKKKAYSLLPPRLTFWAYVAVLRYMVVPFLAALTLADAVLYLFFRYVLESCYGVLCFL